MTAKVVGDVLGDKIRIAKYKPKTGYKRHAGHRSQLTEIEITSIGLKAATKSTAKDEEAAPAAKEKPAAKARPAAKPKAAAAKKAPAKKTPAKKEDA